MPVTWFLVLQGRERTLGTGLSIFSRLLLPMQSPMLPLPRWPPVIVKSFTGSQQLCSTKLTVTVNFASIASTIDLILPISFRFATTTP